MRAWEVADPAPVDTRPLRLVERAVPEPGAGEIRIRVSACGVCRTDLHVVEGDLPPHRPTVVPGHEVVGRVDALGPGCTRVRLGDRVGVAWLAHTCGSCVYCLRGAENLCPRARFTGWDVDGGYAELIVAEEAYVYELPDGIEDAAAAHLTAQVALSEGATVHVLTRGEQDRELALQLGATSARGAYDAPPEPLDAAILFAPVGDLVPVALAALDRGGTLAVAGIHLSDVLALRYQEHLFQERTLRSVTAHTREDGRALLATAERVGVRATIERYPFERADEALADLAHGRFRGAAVLVLDDGKGPGKRPTGA
jgi:propanol-preferring alcohol dehydrogenase